MSQTKSVIRTLISVYPAAPIVLAFIYGVVLYQTDSLTPVGIFEFTLQLFFFPMLLKEWLLVKPTYQQMKDSADSENVWKIPVALFFGNFTLVLLLVSIFALPVYLAYLSKPVTKRD